MSDFMAKMHQILFRLGFAPDPAGEANDAPPDPLVGWEGIGAYGASIPVPSALASAPAAPRFCRTIFMSVAPPLLLYLSSLNASSKFV